MRASASSATAKVTKRRIVQLVVVVVVKGADGRRRRTKRARVVEARTEGQEGQSNKQEERNNDAPGPAPAYDPASVIDYIDSEPTRARRFLGPCNGRWHGFQCRSMHRQTVASERTS